MKNILCSIIFILFAYYISSAQCYPDRHNTTWYDGWISCELAPNPNTARGMSHWILYNLGAPYKLGSTKIWNSNHPDHLDRGLRDIVVDYSMDGVSWLELGSFTLDQGSGLTTYEGQEGPAFNEIEAQYVLVTGISNYGGNCFGLSEISFLESTKLESTSSHQINSELHCLSTNIYPNPFSDAPNIDIKSNCGKELILKVVDPVGNTISEQVISRGKTTVRNEFIKELSSGVYFLHIGDESRFSVHKLMKM